MNLEKVVVSCLVTILGGKGAVHGVPIIFSGGGEGENISLPLQTFLETVD